MVNDMTGERDKSGDPGTVKREAVIGKHRRRPLRIGWAVDGESTNPNGPQDEVLDEKAARRHRLGRPWPPDQ